MKKRVTALLCAVFWLVIWQLGAMALNQKILLASPVEVIQKIFVLSAEPDFWKSILFSAGRILLGFVLGLVIGVSLAAAAGKLYFVRRLLSPLVSALKAVPVASFTILALIWVSSKNLSVLVTFLICLPIIYLNMLEGIDSLDMKLTEMARVFEIPSWRRIVGIYLSQLLPYFRSAVGLAIGLCWKSGVAAEVIGIPVGSVGEKLYQAKVYLETADLFAWTVVVILASYICEKLFMAAVNLLVKRVERM
ncbi:MAG: ABC transporter permease subunit [Bacteroides sp.]|nr:ABC transporter permease subunit [Bacteroides sp.]